jgi:hypothetical protein
MHVCHNHSHNTGHELITAHIVRSFLSLLGRKKLAFLFHVIAKTKKRVTHVHDQSLVTWATCFFDYLVPIVLVGTFRSDRLFGGVSFASKTTF